MHFENKTSPFCCTYQYKIVLREHTSLRLKKEEGGGGGGGGRLQKMKSKDFLRVGKQKN